MAILFQASPLASLSLATPGNVNKRKRDKVGGGTEGEPREKKRKERNATKGRDELPEEGRIRHP